MTRTKKITLLSDKRFPNMKTLLDYVDRKPQWPLSACQSHDKHDPAWSGSPDFKTALELARHGWPEGREHLHKAIGAIATATTHNPLSSFRYDVAGRFPHVARAVAGDPLNMFNPYPEEMTVKPIVRLAYQSNSGAQYKGKELLNFGAAFVSICDALEQADYRVEITACTYVSTSGGNVFGSVIVKQAEDHFDIDRMAFTLAHPSMLRRVWFGSYEQEKDLERYLGGSYGRPVDLTAGLLDDEVTVCKGVRMFEAGSATLKTPLAAFNAALPKILSLLNLEGQGV